KCNDRFVMFWNFSVHDNCYIVALLVGFEIWLTPHKYIIIIIIIIIIIWHYIFKKSNIHASANKM
ncbi:MAG: hypothetical protein N7Q72_02650, partial [Spiroplasma sp. Tabriz.8]|nr:hypothetical protein [Spiroplasma sp. Tabriz.8]